MDTNDSEVDGIQASAAIPQQRIAERPSPPRQEGLRMRFAVCPSQLICPHQGCTYPHHDDPGRLTRHWRRNHSGEIMPEGEVDDAFYTWNTSRRRAHLCPHDGCFFSHNPSITRLNEHLSREHPNVQLPTSHHLPYHLVPCFDCNQIIDHRSVRAHARTCSAGQLDITLD